METIDINQIDINLVEFETKKGTIDINPQAVAMVLNEEEKFRDSCVIFLNNGMKCVISETRKEAIRKLQRLK